MEKEKKTSKLCFKEEIHLKIYFTMQLSKYL